MWLETATATLSGSKDSTIVSSQAALVSTLEIRDLSERIIYDDGTAIFSCPL